MLSVDLYCIIACCSNKFAGASIFIIAHPGSSLQSLIPCSFLPYHPLPPKPKTGFHLPRALATAQRLAVLETLVPNPPNPQFPPPSALNGKDQAHSTLLWVHPASALRQGNLNNSTSTAEAGHLVAAASLDVFTIATVHSCPDCSSSSVPNPVPRPHPAPTSYSTASSREEMCQLLIAR